MEYENPWLWKGESFTADDVKNFFGFVYLITNKITHKKYIGRKYFYSTTRVAQKGKKNKKIVKKQSDWMKYYGSSKNLQVDVTLHGKENFSRVILSLHEARGDVNYHEVKEQIIRNVLECEDYYNDNILTRFYRKANKAHSLFSSEK